MKQTLHILIADDEDIVHTTIGDYLRDVGHDVEEARDGTEALKMIESHDFDLALVDIRMPRLDGLKLLEEAQKVRPALSVILITAHANMQTVIEALRLGAADFLAKPVKFLELDAVIEKAIRVRELRQGRRRLKETIRGLQTLSNSDRRFVGASQATQRVRGLVAQAVEAKVDTILITGDTGTGKEVVAREIHFQAGSEEDPFIAVNCPALPESLVESELFGHMRGAFTGATAARAGYFELADGGTLFLDEIGDLSLAAQAKMLRVLETRTLRRIGGSKEIEVDLRVVAATNVALEELVETGKFRRDLLYRLNLFPIYLSPLRERTEDIRPLAEYFLNLYSTRTGRTFNGFSEDCLMLLLSYDYPGNTRELQNIVERAAIFCKGDQIQTKHIILQPSNPQKAAPSASKSKNDLERESIIKALEQARWNRRQAAKILEMPYSTLRFKIKELGIS